MPSLRRRKDFAATLLSPQGQRLSDCYVFIDIETTVAESGRHVSWQGRLTSLSDPQHAYAGLYGLRPQDAEATARIEIVAGAQQRLGITSDEYTFRGSGDPPETA